MKKYGTFEEQVSIHDDCIKKALNNDEYLRDNYRKLFIDAVFREQTINQYKEVFEKANIEKNIFKRWIFKESLMALNNISQYCRLLENSLINKAIKGKPSFKSEIPSILSMKNEKIKEKIKKTLGESIENENIAIILNNSKRYLHSKIFEKQESLIININKDIIENNSALLCIKKIGSSFIK